MGVDKEPLEFEDRLRRQIAEYKRDVRNGIKNPQPRLTEYFIRYNKPHTPRGFSDVKHYEDATERAAKRLNAPVSAHACDALKLALELVRRRRSK